MLYLIPLSWLLTYGAATRVRAEQTRRAISNSRWQKLSTDPAFDYKNKLENPPSTAGSNFLLHFLQAIVMFLSSTAGHVTIAVAAISLLVFIVYKILQSGQIVFSKKQQIEDAIPDTEDIAATNWAQLMQEASNANDLRMAVRYGYMWLLQLFEKKGLIQYRADKTNYEYYLELSDPVHKKLFKALSLRYEFAWYGHLPVTQNDFSTYSNMINTAKKQLN